MTGENRRYFVLHRTEGGEAITGEYGTQQEAQAEYRRLIALGWPQTRTTSVYSADNLGQMQDHLAKRVRLVCAGVGAGYWESDEGREQSRQQAEQEERDLQEDVA